MRIALGLFFIIFGGIFLLREMGIITIAVSDFVWPILFIILGAVILAGGKRKNTKSVEEGYIQ